MEYKRQQNRIQLEYTKKIQKILERKLARSGNFTSFPLNVENCFNGHQY